MKTFIKSICAYIKGDQAEITATKIAKKVSSIFNVEIPLLESKIMECEEAIEDAREVIKKSLMNNGELITDKNSYIENLINAKNKELQLLATLDTLKEQKAFILEQQEIIQK